MEGLAGGVDVDSVLCGAFDSDNNLAHEVARVSCHAERLDDRHSIRVKGDDRLHVKGCRDAVDNRHTAMDEKR
eukprot:1554924-Prymnesium_polylepis.1